MPRWTAMGRTGVAFQDRRFWTLAVVLPAALSAANLIAAENMQAFTERLLPGSAGAIIVSDPRTGRILAVVNPPCAFKEAYTPGSIAKLVLSAAALEEGVISPADKILCRRIPRLLGEPYHCSHPPAGQPFDLAQALANSCNYFFSEVSTRVSSAALAHWYGAFGFGVAGEDFTLGEVRIPDPPRQKALAALGEQGITASPAQVLMAYSAIAARGKVFRLIMPGQHRAPRLEREVPLHAGTLAVLEKGLRECVAVGSCRAAAVFGVAVAGKTGTARALDGSGVTHAWFVGYAPAEAPQVAVVVFLKRGTGGADAAPAAARILKHYFTQERHTP